MRHTHDRHVHHDDTADIDEHDERPGDLHIIVDDDPASNDDRHIDVYIHAEYDHPPVVAYRNDSHVYRYGPGQHDRVHPGCRLTAAHDHAVIYARYLGDDPGADRG